MFCNPEEITLLDPKDTATMFFLVNPPSCSGPNDSPDANVAELKGYLRKSPDRCKKEIII